MLYFDDIMRVGSITFYDILLTEKLHEITHIKSEKRGIRDSINQKFARIRTDSNNSLPIKKILTFHNILILIKSAVNKI